MFMTRLALTFCNAPWAFLPCLISSSHALMPLEGCVPQFGADLGYDLEKAFYPINTPIHGL
jgi:hypothetical protein